MNRTQNMVETFEWLKQKGFMKMTTKTNDEIVREAGLSDGAAALVTILSIDAWRYDGGWTWNQWYRVGTIDTSTLATLKTPRQILRYMREQGYLSSQSSGRVAVADDQYNLVIVNKGTLEPLFAIAYGEVQS